MLCHIPREGHLGKIRFGDVSRKACVQVYGDFTSLLLWDKWPRGQLLVNTLATCLVFKEAARMFSMGAAPCYVPTVQLV